MKEASFKDLEAQILKNTTEIGLKNTKISDLNLKIKKLRIELVQSMLAPREPLKLNRATSHRLNNRPQQVSTLAEISEDQDEEFHHRAVT
jgi:hypothetical protein